MAKITAPIASPGKQLSLRSQSAIQPLPAGTVSLKEGLRWNAESRTGEESPEIRIVSICLKGFLRDLLARSEWQEEGRQYRGACQSEKFGCIEVRKDDVEHVRCWK